MTSTNEDKALILTAFRAGYRAMLKHDTKALGSLLADEFTLTHMTGLVQSKGEWLKAIDAGQMRYHAASKIEVKGARLSDGLMQLSEDQQGGDHAAQ